MEKEEIVDKKDYEDIIERMLASSVPESTIPISISPSTTEGKKRVVPSIGALSKSQAFWRLNPVASSPFVNGLTRTLASVVQPWSILGLPYATPDANYYDRAGDVTLNLAGKAAGLYSGGLAAKMARILGAKAIGRVATNVIPPARYDNKLRLLVNTVKNNPKEAIKAVIKDEPMWWNPEKVDVPLFVDQTWALPARDAPYRRMFHLRQRAVPIWSVDYPDANINLKGAHKLYKEIVRDGKKYLIPNQYGKSFYPHFDMTYYNCHPVLGHFNSVEKVNQYGKGYTEFSDLWDFALNPLEKKFISENKKIEITNALRYLVDKITDPVTITGKAWK